MSDTEILDFLLNYQTSLRIIIPRYADEDGAFSHYERITNKQTLIEEINKKKKELNICNYIKSKS